MNETSPETSAPLSSALAGVWLCGGLGVIILCLFPRTLQWLGSVTLGTHFDPFVLPDGTVVPYPRTDAFWPDLGPTTLGLMLLIEGLTFLVPRRRGLLMAALICVGAIVLFNAGYFVLTFSRGVAVISAIAVLVGVPLAFGLIQRVRQHSRRQPSGNEIV